MDESNNIKDLNGSIAGYHVVVDMNVTKKKEKTKSLSTSLGISSHGIIKEITKVSTFGRGKMNLDKLIEEKEMDDLIKGLNLGEEEVRSGRLTI